MTDTLLDAVSAVAREAGALAMNHWRGDFEQWEKSPGNPVSEVDLAVDQLLQDRLAALDPEAGWLSEETADSAERLLLPRVWVVDPIDGTRAYISGVPVWGTLIGLMVEGRAVAGLMAQPFTGETCPNPCARDQE